MTESTKQVLPRNVRPKSYKLTLQPNLEDFTFKGQETVEIEIVEPTDAIVLNCVEIAIETCRLTLDDGSEMATVDTSLNEEDETATFRFHATLPVGPASLHLQFTGLLNDKLRGFYRSRYSTEDGEERYLATTQFEATDARRAFPCWDEPALKARFQVTLVIPSHLVAVSNMPVTAESDAGPGSTKVEFAETPPMSTYLLAFVVGDLKSIEQDAAGGTTIRVWTTAGKEEQGRFALDVSVRLLDYFNEYFGIPYPLEKLDHIAIPDFAAGAMENWGAITYRETAVLVDPTQSSAGTRQIVATIVSHEMAHMWFGDLVTMEWWNDLWLNESFASWMGDKAVDHLYPEWEMWTQFVNADTTRAMALDGLKNSHPIEQEVNNPAEIGQLFDAISYSKGGSILRMLEHFLGADAFCEGLRSYIAKHQYANARQSDLWDALGEASGQPVAAMMDTWVNQTGYPVLDVETARSEDGIEISASQTRFVYEYLVNPDVRDDTLWHVPLSALAEGVGNPASTLMEARTAKLHVPLGPREATGRWTKVNPEQTGFYRVNYSADDWERLRPAIQSLVLAPVDRLGIQNDAYALSKAGFLPVIQFLILAEAYVNETDASVWSDLTSNLGGIDTLLVDEAFYSLFEAFARRLFKPTGNRMGWDARRGEGHLDSLMRSTVLSALGNYDDVDTLTAARDRFARYEKDPNEVHPDIRRVVLDLAGKQGDRSTYDTLRKLEKTAQREEEKLRLLMALTQFEKPELLKETLERSLSTDVRSHNTITVVVGVAGNRHGRDLAWEFIKDNWPEFDRRYGKGGFGLMRLVGFTSRFTTQDKLEDVEGFFKANPVPAAERTIRQSLEAIRLNIAWLDLNREELAGWFVG